MNFMSSLEQRTKFIGYLKFPSIGDSIPGLFCCHGEVDLGFPSEFSCYCKQYVHGYQASTRLEAVRIGMATMGI